MSTVLVKTRSRRPGLKGHPINFMIILDRYYRPQWTHLNPFGPIKAKLYHSDPFNPFWKSLDQFGSILTYLTYLDPHGQIWCHLEQLRAIWTNLDANMPLRAWFLLSQKVAQYFVPRGCVFFFSSQEVSRFFLSKEVAWTERLGDCF